MDEPEASRKGKSNVVEETTVTKIQKKKKIYRPNQSYLKHENFLE